MTDTPNEPKPQADLGRIVSLNDRRKAKDSVAITFPPGMPQPTGQPDPDCINRQFTKDKVITTYRFCGTYEFEGEEWVFDLWAQDFAEAERKLKAMGAGRIDGQMYSVIPNP